MSAYLTFDDGPIYPNTERVLEILADFEVAATFFMVGRNVDANPALAARVVQEGHAVGNHSYSHPDLTTLNQQAASNEIGLTQRAIWNATGVWPTIMRPPYGSSNQSVDQLIENWGLSVAFNNYGSFPPVADRECTQNGSGAVRVRSPALASLFE